MPNPATADFNLAGLDLGYLKQAVGATTYQRGCRYAAEGRVVALACDDKGRVLAGSVEGSGRTYRTVVEFTKSSAGDPAFLEGDCSCPVGLNCKHAVALVVTAIESVIDRRAVDGSAASDHSDAASPMVRSWERSLRAIVSEPALELADVPMAIEFELRAVGNQRYHGLTLKAGLKRPGARANWISGGLRWDRLEYLDLRNDDIRHDHVELARELYAVHCARSSASMFRYGYGDQGRIDLAQCNSRQLWSILDEAKLRGMPLLHANRQLGEVRCDERGMTMMDVTRRSDSGLSVTAAIQVEGDDANELQPLLFIGSAGHGVLCARRDEIAESADPKDLPLHLVRLDNAPSPQLRQMAIMGKQLEVPADDASRFVTDFYPRLRHLAVVRSSDNSFTPPEISAPVPLLRAEYVDGKHVAVSWQWRYEIGDEVRRFDFDGGGPTSSAGFRNFDEERTALDRLRTADHSLRDIGLLDETGKPNGAARITLDGANAVRFATDVLPQFAADEDTLRVEIVGEQPEYRDVGDTLRIGVSTSSIDGDRDWFDLDVTVSIDERELPFREVFGALAHGDSMLVLPDGAYISLLDPKLQSLRDLMEEARQLGDTDGESLRINRFQTGFWEELVALGVVTTQAEEWQQRVSPLIEFDAISGHDLPTSLAATLRPYQRDGYRWLTTLWELGLGGILADDMGLGKTLQTLALICHARETSPGAGPFLVVAPTSVVSNWVDEAERFAPELAVRAVTGTFKRSGRSIDEVAEADVVVTSYALFRLDAETYRSIEWSALVLDEAQQAKNRQSKIYECIRRLQAPFKLAITGTPLENNLMELWSLLSFTAPGLFPTPTSFAEYYARPIERGSDPARLAQFRRRIKPLVLRRTKELVASDLPDKQEQELIVDLHTRHRKAYDTHLQRERQKILDLIDDFDRNRFTILRSITLLRQLSLDASLVERGKEGAGKKPVPSAKIDALAEQLGDVVGSGHHALVFSQFTRFLSLVRKRLDEEGIEYCYLDGRTRKREEVIRRFKQGDAPVFLISLKSGGFGLNLTEADYCFLLDPWWNPAVEAQAIDRTHRIGQTRPVNVYRLIARDTIEEKVVELARRKSQLFKSVMDEGDMFASAITADDVRSLLG